MNDIYLKIKNIRVKKNLTQEEVAKKIGMAQSNYARMERGLSQITVERLEEIAVIFEMSPESILSYSNEIGDFKEDAQYYYNQVKRLESKIKKLEKDLRDTEDNDSDFYSRKELESKKQQKRIEELRKDLLVKDAIIQEKLREIEKLQKEIDEKNKSIEHLQGSNTKLLDANSRLLEMLPK